MSAFRQSVEAMIPSLRRYARALARDADIADDLVQDTLVRALRSERLFLGGDVRSWLYTILTNLNKNRRRSLARRPQFMPLLENNADPPGIVTVPASLVPINPAHVFMSSGDRSRHCIHDGEVNSSKGSPQV